MSQLAIIFARVLQAIPTIFGIVVVTFLLTRALPGDPAAYFAGASATPESIAEIRSKLGLDQPLPVQFLGYVRDLASGDLGQSISTGQPVATELLRRLPASLELTLFALLLSVAVAVPLGVLAAVRQDSWVDQLCRFVVTAGVSLPTFFTGLLLVYVCYFLLGWAPAPLGRLDMLHIPPPQVTGFLVLDGLIAREWGTAWSAFKQLLLPGITLALFTLAPIARMTRASMLQALASEYLRTARAAGLFVLLNLAIDTLYTLIDPRVRIEG